MGRGLPTMRAQPASSHRQPAEPPVEPDVPAPPPEPADKPPYAM